MNFAEWFEAKEKECEAVLKWLNEESGITGWYLQHTGGGCTAYQCYATRDGIEGEYMLTNDSSAEPVFVYETGDPKEPTYPWMLCFYDLDENGEQIRCLNIAEPTDLRDGFKPENQNKDPEWEWFYTPPEGMKP